MLIDNANGLRFFLAALFCTFRYYEVEIARGQIWKENKKKWEKVQYKKE